MIANLREKILKSLIVINFIAIEHRFFLIKKKLLLYSGTEVHM